MIFRQRVVFARAVFVCEQLNILTQDPVVFATSSRGAASAPEEGYRLYFPYISNEDYRDRCCQDEKVTGVIIVESIMRKATCSLQAFPCGVLIFRCSREKRDSILSSCLFRNSDITAGHIQLVWLAKDEVYMLHNELIIEPNIRQHTWQSLWRKAEEKMAMRNESKDKAPFPENTFCFQLWEVQNLFTTWSKAVGHWNTEGNESPPPRKMTPLEHIWMYFHISLRWRRELNVDPMTMDLAFQNMEVTGDYVVDTSLKSNDIGLDMVIEQEYHGLMAQLLGSCQGLADELLSSYSSLCDILRKGKDVVQTNLTNPMQEARQRFKAFPLYVSCKLKTFTEESIDTIPLSMFDFNAIESWSKARGQQLIDTDMNAEKVFTSVYEKATPVFLCDDKAFLRLYGNANSLLLELKKHDANVGLMKYQMQRLGSLSTDAVGVLPLYGMKNYPRLGSPFDISTTSTTSVRLIEASEHCTPIWTVPTKTGMNFFRVVPNLTLKRKNGDDIDTVDNLIAKHMYPLDSPRPTMTNEYLQSGLHWSSFVADIDLRVQENSPRPEIGEVARDAVIAFDNVFETIFSEYPKVRHLVFASKDDGEANKLGLHHHAILPPGLVFTSWACRDMANILETTRHLYPKTIGLSGADDTPVYDLAIYPAPISGKVTGHSLRGPFQVKFDGTRKLELVLDTDKSPLTVNDLLVHGPQFNETKTERIVFGRIVDGFNGVHELADIPFFRNYESYVMNDNMKSVCRTSAREMMEEINKKTVLFDPEIDSPSLLLSIVNSLWNSRGKERTLRHMKTTVGNHGKKYDAGCINRMNNSKFVYDSKKETINLVVDSRSDSNLFMPFCLRRPHNKRQTGGLVINVGYSCKMIRFVLFQSRCFKRSCHSQGQGQFLPNLEMPMRNVFVAPIVERDAETFFTKKFRDTKVRVIEINRCMSEDEPAINPEEEFDVAKARIQTEDIVHDGLGAFIYIHEGNFVNSIRNVFMFMKDRVLVFSLVTNMYLVCIVRQEFHPELKKVVELSSVYASPVVGFLLRHLTEKRLLNERLLELLQTTMSLE